MTSSGTSGDDNILGTAGSDSLNGGAGSDTIDGGGGSDKLSGGSGDDILNGGSGSDIVNGDSGNDTLVYNVTENIGAKDTYTGGSGIDTVLVQLTEAQWLDAGIRTQLQNYVQFLTTVKMNSQGEVSNGSVSDFTFTFASGQTLTVQMMEKLVVAVQNTSGGYDVINHLQSLVSGTSTGSVIEAGGVANGTVGAPTASGDLYSDDLNGNDDAFQAVGVGAATANQYGTYSVTAAGVWTYTLDDSNPVVQALNTSSAPLTDSFTVLSQDGTAKVVTVTINGTNDAAVITGTSTGTVIEAGGVANGTAGTPTATGDLLASDVDNTTDAFQAVAAGGATTNHYGTYSVTAAGVWTYTLDDSNPVVQALNSSSTPLTDSFTVLSEDGTARVVTVTINGTNDAAVITGSSTAELTESNAAQSTGGDLNATDVDSSAAFVAQSNVGGSNGYGTFSIDASGAWTYTMNDAHDEFVGGQDYTDSITVATADGTTQVLTVTMHGTNDAAVITGSSTAELTESNAAQSTGGDLNATDVDSSAAFVAQSNVGGSNGYGTFSIDASGAWTYTMNDAHDEFVGGQDYTDSITVATADGTTQVLTVTMHGTNDAAVITGSSTAELTESNAAQSTGGDLNATDVDSSAAFVAQSNVGGSNGYGTFSIDASGAWTYTMNDAHDEFVGGQDYTDSITVATADGTTQVLTVTMHGTNDAAVITGSSTAELTESNAAQSTGGDLNATDVDSSAAFVAQSNVGGSNGYGTFSIDASGAWTYTMNDAHDEFVGGQDYTDSITVATADGTTQVLTVTMHGTNDAAVITGSSTAELTESNAAQSTGGDLNATDVDSSAAFVAQSNVGGSNGYGTFSIDASGAWTYTMNDAHDEFVGGQDYTDSITVATADGTTQVLTVTMHGTNDAAVITGSSTAELTESNAAQSTGGDLNATDVDSSAAFVAQSNVGGSNGYGTFSIDASGAWTYTMNDAHDEFVGGQDYTDSITVATADGTTQVLTVTMHGTNDAAVITGSSTAELTESNAAQSTGGDLNATDVDSSAAFVAQSNVGGSNGYGTFSIDASGAWTYTMNDAHDEFVGGQDYTDSITVATADGTTQVLTVTMHGTNDAAVITGSSTAELTESNAAQSTGGDLNATDVDSSAAFVAQSNVGGSNGYGTFSIDASGAWTYTMNDAHDEFVGGQDYTDSITVATADGTTQVLTVTMHGTNDAAVITGSSTAELTESNAAQSTGGDLNATDVDSSAAFVAQSNVGGSNGYGTFSIDASGAWTYTMNDAHDEFVGGQDYTDSITVATADGTTQVLTVTMHGTNDAAVITGSSTAELTESNAAQSTGGDLNATDVDSSAAFVAQSNVGGSNGYGTFSIDASGAWTYTMNDAHDEFVGGQDYTDSITVATADGTTQVLTVTMHGTNDAAVITGSSTAELTESNAAQSTGGDLNATDVDSSAAFVAQSNVGGSNGYGTFSIDASGAWTYTMNDAHDEFVGGQDYTDSITVATADGTTQVLTVTMHGTNDAAVITGSSTAELTESNAAQSTGGDLNATDVDSSAAFVAQSNVGGSNGYGTFSIDASGAWTYTMNDAHDEFVGGQDYTDSITVATADGTTQVLTVTMHGTNDAAVITGSSTAELTESNAAQSTGGDLNATDVDSSAAFVAQSNVGGSNGYGTFSIDASGAWTYTMNDAHDEFVGGQDYTDSITVATADGTTQVLTVTMHGTNDAAVNTVPGAQVTNEDTAKAITGLSIADPDGGVSPSVTLSVTHGTLAVTGSAGVVVAGSGSGSVTLTGSVAAINAALAAVGGVTYMPVTNYNGGDALTMATSDGALTDTDIVSFTIVENNDNPVAVADRIIVSNSTAVTIAASSLLANDTDIDGLALLVTGVGNAAGITGLSFNATTGMISFTSGVTAGPAAGSFQYTVSDGKGGTSTATVTIDVRTVAPGNTVDTIDLSAAGAYQASYIDGRGGADDLTGGIGGDMFLGGSGNAADELIGSTGNDVLIGGDGNDILSGGAGNDVLRGGAGSNDSMDGGDGLEDLLDFSDGTSAINFTLAQSSSSSSIANGTGGLGNNDTYQNMEGVIGTGLNDIITGSSGNDVIRGGAGNDTLNGAAGLDLIDFSDGTAGINFTLVNNGVGTAFNTGAANLGTDTYSGFEGVIGTNFADSLTGSASNDQIRGGIGNDILDGAGGNDILVGGAGADTMTGGAGSDTFVYRSGDAAAVDTITDFNAAGGDVLDISDLLIGLPTLTGANVGDYLDMRESGVNTIVSIDRDGTGSGYGFQDFVVLQNVTGLNLTTLLGNGNIDWTP